MNKPLTAPMVKRYVDWLRGVRYQDSFVSFTYDARTYELLDEVFELLKQIASSHVSDRAIWNLWFKADRGPIEDFGDYDEWYEAGEVNSREEFENWWLSTFPAETEWYEFQALDDEEIGYRAIDVGNRFVIELDSRKKKSYENDISEFAEWIRDSIKECIEGIRDGSYNDMVERELPPQHKTGTIIRSQLWAIFPDWKAEFFADISKDDVNDFLRIAEAQSDRAVANIGRLQGFTANDFFECCALGYKAIGFVVEGMTPREQYYKYADGRDNGLGEIDPVSAVAYREWYDDRHKGGGHPWEICRGGNSTHISLYVSLDDNGAYLHVAGSAVGRTIEAVKFFLALYRAGKPVLIHDAHELASRLNGTEKIGVVPADVFPRYCSSMFPDEKIIAFMNLPDEKREEVARCCVWQPLRKATLINNTGGDDA